MTDKKEWISIALMVVSALVFYYLMQDYEHNAILFPRMMVIIMLCLAGCKAMGELVLARTASREGQSGEKYPLPRVLFVLAAMVVYIMVLEDVGFYTSAFLFFFIVTLVIQPFERTPRVVAMRFATCFGFILFLYMLFGVLLKVQLPRGILV
ncbi:tripartite tricarboxylate transporter TctB family protein [Desulfovibrio sp. OttesenSCG-928-G15]|nr:tripartite tricarboxylate transporter TctB family protein [Desulfovibrio sp. OttesenSCG-928-G15]